MIIAHFFGTSREIEIFFATNVIIYVVMKLSQAGEMSEIILPIYHKFKYDVNLETGQRVVSTVLNWYAIALIALSFIVFMIAPWLIKVIVPGFGETDHILGTQMIRSVSPLLVIMFLSGQIQSLINAEKIFGLPEAIGLASRIILIITVVLGYNYFSIWIMIISLWVSTLLNFFLLVFYYYRAGNRHYFQLTDQRVSVFPIVKKIWSTLPYVGATQIWAIVFNAGLSTLPGGTLAIFTYSRTLATKLSNVFLRPMSIVFFTYFSEEYSKERESLHSITSKALEYIPLIIVPSIIIFILAGQNILGFLWYGDKFGLDSIELSSRIVTILLLMLLIEGLSIIARKIVMSLGYARLTYSLLSISQILTACYAFPAIKYWGVTGAISSIIVNMLFFAMVPFIILLLREKQYLFFYKFSTLMKWILSGGLSYVVLSILNHNIANLINMQNIRMNFMFNAGITSILATSITLGFAALFNIIIVKNLLQKITNRVKLVFV